MFTSRRVIMPEPGKPFLGSARAGARARERRRRVFTVMLEALGLTVLIGLFPPLRAMWIASAVLGALLLVYVWMLLQLRSQPGDRSAAGTVQPRRAPVMAAVQPPQFPVIESADGRRVVIISEPALRRRSTVAG